MDATRYGGYEVDRSGRLGWSLRLLPRTSRPLFERSLLLPRILRPVPFAAPPPLEIFAGHERTLVLSVGILLSPDESELIADVAWSCSLLLFLVLLDKLWALVLFGTAGSCSSFPLCCAS